MTNKLQKPSRKRKTPKHDVLRELYLKSGNVCAFPDCNLVMIDRNGEMIGEICHIEAVSPGGKRFNKNMTEDECRGFDNLLLLCPGHHKVIDGKKTQYSVAEIRQMKVNHEEKFSAISNTLSQGYKHQYIDSTDKVASTYPLDCNTLFNSIPDLKKHYEAELVVKEIREYIDRLRVVPDKYKRFMLAVIERFIKLGHNQEQPAVDVHDLEESLNIPRSEMQELTQGIERYGIGGLFETWNENEYEVKIYNPDPLYWHDIIDYCKKQKLSLSDFVIDLRFGLLD